MERLESDFEEEMYWRPPHKGDSEREDNLNNLKGLEKFIREHAECTNELKAVLNRKLSTLVELFLNI